MSREERKLSAAEARELADRSQKFTRCLFNSLADAAGEGHTVLNWDVCDASRTLLTRVVQELRDLGYVVEGFNYDSESIDPMKNVDNVVHLIIRW